MKFSERLRALGFGTYAEYLAAGHWADFRQRYKAAGHRMTCLVCSGKRIQLHHQTYARLGGERFEDVIPVCRVHHTAIHEWLRVSGKRFVEYTHEAVAALGGVCPPLKRRMPAQGKALGLRKRDANRAARKAAKKARQIEKRRLAASVVIATVAPEMAELVALFSPYCLTNKQTTAVAKFVATNDAKQLRGFLKSIQNDLAASAKTKTERVQNKPKATKRTREQEQAHAEAKRKASAALSMFRRLKGVDRVNALRDAVNRASGKE